MPTSPRTPAHSADSPPSVSSPRPRSLWRQRDYLLLWSGQALSDIGGAISDLAFPLLVLAITRSPAQTGVVVALGALPRLVISLPAGVLVDRWDRRRVMLVCDLARGLIMASIVVAFALGVLTFAQLALAALLQGVLTTLFDLAKSAALAQVVAAEQLPAAIAREEFVEGTTSLFGPTLSGVLYTAGAIFPFAADALSYGFSLLTLGLIRTPFQRERATPPRHLRAELADGLRWVCHQPFILAMTLMMGAGAFVMPGSTLTVIILVERADGSAAAIGLIFAAFGVGAILGSILVPQLARRLSVGQRILLTRWWFVVSWPLYALTPFPAVLAAIQFGDGIVEPIEDVAYFSRRLELIPEEMRGRVLSACRMAPGLTRPIGLALTGLLIQQWGVFPTVWAQWACLLVTTALLTIVPAIRRER